MAKYYYQKGRKLKKAKILSLVIILSGVSLFLYIFFPIISWQIYFAPVFASQNLQIPIPKANVVGNYSLTNLINSATRNLTTDYTNANNWYPNFQVSQGQIDKTYFISIPKAGVTNAVVKTANGDLAKNLVQYNANSFPPNKGNNIIFGHSTLPQLFDPNNYKTIFANLYKVGPGDIINVKIDKVSYNYKVDSVTVVEPDDTSILSQNFGESFITLITCTPPGTIWKRLIIRAKITNL